MKAELNTNGGTLIVSNSYKNHIGLKFETPNRYSNICTPGHKIYIELDAKELLEAVKAAYNLSKD